MVKKGHPAWGTMILIFMIMFSLYSIAYNTTSLFIDPISTDLGISRTATNLIITIRSIGSLITLSVSGYFFKRFGIKKMMIYGTIGSALSMFLFSYSSNLTSMYLCYFTMGLCLGYVSDLSCSIIINNWFNEKTSLANGISATGSGIGGAIFSSITGFIIGGYGWRNAYRFLAIIGFVLTILPVLRLRVYPSEIGAKPYGYSRKKTPVDRVGVNFEEVKNKSAFWQVWLCTILISYSFFIVMVGFPAHLLNMGYSIEATGTIAAVMMLVMSIMKIVLGYMYDELDISHTILIVCSVLILGIISAINVRQPIFLILSIFCFALGSANFSQSLQGVSRKLFGRKDYGSILRVFMIGSNGGGLVCPVLSGLAFDAFGSYIPLFKIVLIPAIILLFASQISIRKVKVEITSQFAQELDSSI